MDDMKHIDQILNKVLAKNNAEDYEGTDLIKDQKEIWKHQHASKNGNKASDPF